MRPGQVERRTHDYVRHGTTDLFAALDVQTGKVIGTCCPQHRAQEFRAFLDLIDRNVPPDLDIHLVLDCPPGDVKRLRRHPQNTADSALAGETAALPPALHAYLRLLVELGRELVRPAHRAPAPARRLP
jgi:hypothetical protein